VFYLDDFYRFFQYSVSILRYEKETGGKLIMHLFRTLNYLWEAWDGI